mgnify:CR=1 FL=1
MAKNVFILSGWEESKDVPNLASLSPSEAYNLDLIIDDGFPLSGSITVLVNDEDDCFVAGEYKLQDEIKECIVKFAI